MSGPASSVCCELWKKPGLSFKFWQYFLSVCVRANYMKLEICVLCKLISVYRKTFTHPLWKWFWTLAELTVSLAQKLVILVLLCKTQFCLYLLFLTFLEHRRIGAASFMHCSTEVINYVWFFNTKCLPCVISCYASTASREYLKAGLLERIVSQIYPVNISTCNP